MEIDIKKYIEERIPELSGRLYPIFTTDISELTIAYKFTDVSGGHIRQTQLELKVIGVDYDICEQIKAKLKELLDMEEDEPFVVYGTTRFHISLSAGGGCLFNEGCQMYEDTCYFVIIWRKANE